MKRTYSTPEIHCHSCAGLIQDTLDGVPGVAAVKVDVPAKTVTIDYSDDAVETEQKVVDLLKEEGYSAHRT
jgi:copper chaperone CopZ